MTETKTQTLTEFLLARIAEDESTARAHPELGWEQGHWELIFAWDRDYTEPSDLSIAPARVLAECDAKRLTVRRAEHADAAAREPGTDKHVWVTRRAVADAWRLALLSLAAAYADHPDYQPAWRP